MATKYRKDLTEQDFYLLRCFKHNLLTGIKDGRIKSPLTRLVLGYYQEWRKAGEWRPNRLVKQSNVISYILDMSEFRKIVRAMQEPIPDLTEGRMVDTLKRASMILLESDGGWKRRPGVICLEYRRLSPEGNLRPRDENSAEARLHQAKEGLLPLTADQVLQLEVEVEERSRTRRARREEIRLTIRKRL